MADARFELAIDLTEVEHSKDSHANSYEIRVEGTTVEYEGPYGKGVRGQFDTASVAFDLTADQRRRIERTLTGYDLLQSVEETVEETPSVPYHEIVADATLVVGGESHELHLAGPMGGGRALSHDEQASGLRRVCSSLRRWAEAATDT